MIHLRFQKVYSWGDVLSAVRQIGVKLVNAIDGKSTLVQVMAWCLTAPSHYMNQCWPRSYGVTRPQWVNPHNILNFLEETQKRIYIFCCFMSLKCHWNSTGSWNPLSWKTSLCYIAGDDVMSVGSKEFTGIILINTNWKYTSQQFQQELRS